MTQEKQNKILVPDGVRTKLRDLFKTSYPTVRGALNGETNSELARKIRHTAIERFGGVELDTRVVKIKK
ncbi:hypothetical protein GGQ94_000771 [Petrimonas sulfuriphila]|jgi:hypothetical protein